MFCIAVLSTHYCSDENTENNCSKVFEWHSFEKLHGAVWKNIHTLIVCNNYHIRNVKISNWQSKQLTVVSWSTLRSRKIELLTTRIPLSEVLQLLRGMNKQYISVLSVVPPYNCNYRKSSYLIYDNCKEKSAVM